MFGSAFSRVCAVSCYVSMNRRRGSRTEHTPRVYRCLSTWWTHTRSIPRSLRARTLLNVFCTLAQRTKTNASALSRTITPLCPFDRRLRSIKRCHWIERSHSFESSEPHFLRQRFDLTFRHAQLIAPGLQGLRVLTIAYSLFFCVLLVVGLNRLAATRLRTASVLFPLPGLSFVDALFITESGLRSHGGMEYGSRSILFVRVDLRGLRNRLFTLLVAYENRIT